MDSYVFQSRESQRSAQLGSADAIVEGADASVTRSTPAPSKTPARSKNQPAKPDDDLDTVLDISESKREWDSTGRMAYERACKKYSVNMSQTVYNRLAIAPSIDLPHYGLGPAGTKAIAVALVVNTRVTSLNVRGNQLGPEGAAAMCEMMLENQTITHLNLSDNQLRKGVDSVADLLRFNTTITCLDISENEFGDKEAQAIAEAVEEHPSLAELNLSKNKLGVASGIIFKKLVAENVALTELNLSWNQLRGAGAVAIAEALKDNVGMKTLDLSWNGFDRAAAMKLAEAFRVNRSLVSIDLFSNRIESTSFLAMIKALADNDSLQTLKVGKNSITEQAASAALELLKGQADLNLQTLDLSELIFSKAFASKASAVSEIHSEFVCVHGYTDSYGKRKLKSYDVVSEALQFFNDYMTENNLNLVGLFAEMLEEGSTAVSYDQFREGLKKAKIPLTSLQVDQLIAALDADGDGDIDFSEIVIGAEEHKQ